jgi:hypothetical protein
MNGALGAHRARDIDIEDPIELLIAEGPSPLRVEWRSYGSRSPDTVNGPSARGQLTARAINGVALNRAPGC